MTLNQMIPVLQLSVGPVIVISGAGLVLLLMTNRYARVIDRTRSLAQSIRDASGDEKKRYCDQLLILGRRACQLRTAITFASISTLLAPFLIIALFFVTLFDLRATWLIIIIFISCMATLVVGLIIFIFDVNASLAALKVETNIEELN